MIKHATVLAAFAALSLPAHAVVEGTVDSNSATSAFEGVGAVRAGSGLASGILISDQYVLTAAHVVDGFRNNPGGVRFQLNNGSGQTLTAAEIFIHDSYTGTSNTLWHDDLALIRLAAPVTGDIPYYDFFYGDFFTPGFLGLGGTGLTFTMVGYGGGGDGNNGVTTGANATVKRSGANIVDETYADDDGSGFDEVFRYTFDEDSTLASEAHLAGGDSGGPVLVFQNNQWMIAGVSYYVGASSGPADRYGSYGGGLIISPYVDWINGIVRPVPEAETWAMMLAGLGLVGWMARRRRG